MQGAMGSFANMSILLSIQFINAGISLYEMRKSVNAVAKLKASLAAETMATVKRGGKWQNLDKALLVKGDLVRIYTGLTMPADCYVNEGRVTADNSAMTGARRPVTFCSGDLILSGSFVTEGEVYVRPLSIYFHIYFPDCNLSARTLFGGDARS